MRFGGSDSFETREPELEAQAPSGAEGAWTAILLAGNRNGHDPLAERFGLRTKALIPIAGEPMIGHVVRALAASPSIGRILILAQEPELLVGGDLDWIGRIKRVRLAESRNGIAESVARLAGTDSAPLPLLVTTADHPLLTSEMIEHFLSEAEGSDVGVGVVEREILLRDFPGNERTWHRFKGGAYTGANLFTIRTDGAGAAFRAMAKAENGRKHQLKLLWHFGPFLAIRAAAGGLSLEETTARIGEKLGLAAKAIALPFAEAGIDVDRPGDHRLADGLLAARKGEAGARTGKQRVSIFDLDRTVTRRGTYTRFLAESALRRAPWRLALAPAAASLFLLHLCGGCDRRQLKERLHRLLLGGRVKREEMTALAEGFAERLRSGGFHRDAIERIDAEGREGRRILLATAANEYYAEAIARVLGVDEIICTRSSWDGDHLLPGIDGANCHGAAKLEMIEAHFREKGVARPDLHVRFFSDHDSDAPALGWADEAYAVNPGPRLRGRSRQEGWRVLRWR